MNMLHIIGNLTANPKSWIVNSQKGASTVCEFTIAANRMSRGKETTEFFRVTVWNKQADNCMKYLKKGRKVHVTGSVTASAYLASDGTPRASLEIQDLKELEFLDCGRRQEDDGSAQELGQQEGIDNT